ncbi:MAG: 8-oxoguanine DNA glycosylase [Firmicutes bacterium]|nr:8-oxoguanine DNA glycosylase [Bacillota bacterium]
MADVVVEVSGSDVRFSKISPFNLKDTLMCGQAFRWTSTGCDNCAYTGVVKGKVLRVRQEHECLILEGPVDEDTRNMVMDYFALDVDLGEIENRLREIDPAVGVAIDFSPGIRLLRQDPWEAMVTFIISARNSIPLIRRSVELLAEKHGDPIPQGHRGDACDLHFSFPDPGVLADADIEELLECRTGFKAPYIKEAAMRIASGDFDLYGVGDLEYPEAKKRLMEFKGIGNKVADCILLFAFGFYQAFPIDVWVTRIMRYLYFDSKKVPLRVISEFAHEKFGDLAGYAQQYLFYYARNMLGAEIRGLE